MTEVQQLRKELSTLQVLRHKNKVELDNCKWCQYESKLCRLESQAHFSKVPFVPDPALVSQEIELRNAREEIHKKTDQTRRKLDELLVQNYRTTGRYQKLQDAGWQVHYDEDTYYAEGEFCPLSITVFLNDLGGEWPDCNDENKGAESIRKMIRALETFLEMGVFDGEPAGGGQ